MLFKRCTCCMVTVEIENVEEYFYKRKIGKDGYSNICKRCRSLQAKISRGIMIENKELASDVKCNSCGGNDNVRPLQLNGLYKNVCKRCISLVNGRSFIQNLENQGKKVRDEFYKENIPHYANTNSANAS